ncbi:MAG: hypothetical protein ACI8S6_001870 [Myxococcota bacterium]|jgi:hypothetical protein
MLSMIILSWFGAAWAQSEEPCVCPEEDPAAVFARSTEVFIARSGESIPSELTPLLSLKGELPERVYIADTWESCDLEAGPRGSMMLVIVDDVGHMSRCGGAGPLPQQGTSGAMSSGALRSWLRYGGWLAEAPPEAFLLEIVERELTSNPLRHGEQGVALKDFPGVDTQLKSGVPIRSLEARVMGPRWMQLSVMAGPDDVYYIGWHHEQGNSGNREVWESHALWQVSRGAPAALWRVESPHLPVLDAAPGERIGIESLAGAPHIAAFDDGSAIAVLPGAALFAVELDPARGWKSPQTLSDGSGSAQVAFASGDRAAVVAWVEGDVLRARRYLSGTGWSEPQRLAEPPASKPLLAVNDRGEALMAWRGLEGQLWSRWMDTDGEWSPPEALAGPGASAPHLALADNGRALLSWVEEGSVRARTATGRGRWSKPRAMSYDEAASTPHGAIDRWGRAVVAWIEGSGSHRELLARTHLPLRGWSPEPERLVTNRRGVVGPPVVSMSDTGGATVFWLQESSRAMLWARHFTLRRGWASPEQILLLGPVEPEQQPTAVRHDDGSVSVVWRGDRDGWTSRYLAGAGFGRLAAFEEITPVVQELGADSYRDSGIMFIWSQGDAAQAEIWVREQSAP